MSSRGSTSRVSKSVKSAATSFSKSLNSVTKSTENVVIAILLVILVILVVYYVRQNNEGFESDKPKVYFFFVTWCPHCTNARPVMENVKKNNNNVEVIFVNCEEEKQLASEYNIRAYPTVVLSNNNNNVELETAVSEENVNRFIEENL